MPGRSDESDESDGSDGSDLSDFPGEVPGAIITRNGVPPRG